jgi:hypothetical protein
MEQLSKEEMRSITSQLLGIGAFLLQTENLSVYIDQMLNLENSKDAAHYISLAQILDKARDEIKLIEPKFRINKFVTDLLDTTKNNEAA